MIRLNFKMLLIIFIVLNAIGITLVTLGITKNLSDGQSFRYVNYEIGDVFHDQGYIYLTPNEPTRDDQITIRVRAIRGNIKTAQLQYTFDINSSSPSFVTTDMAYERPDESGYYDYWVAQIPKQNNPFKYHFRLENSKEFIYYNASGYSPANQELRNFNGDFLVMPGFSTPDWSKGATWYSIMPDSFYNGDTKNDKLFQGAVTQNPWGNSHFHTNDYFGGDLLGVENKIDHIKNLGTSAIQFNPFWISTHQAGYGTFDFTQIDSTFGNNNTLRLLTSQLHENNMKIVIDGVFNYFNENGVWYNAFNNYPLAGAVSYRDPYYSMYLRDDQNKVIRSWGSPELDFSSKLTRDLIYATPESVMSTYLNDFDIDGIRLDVGESLRGSDPDNWGTAAQIIKDMRTYVKAIDEDKLLMSEHGSGSLLYDYTLDTKWNYDFGWPVRDWAKGISNNLVLSARLIDGINRLPRPMANASYNFLTTHDESRIMNYVSGDIVKMNAAQLLQMTYIGSPSIYFGDEIGMMSQNNPGVGEKAPTSFDSYNWDESTWNYSVYRYYLALSQLRKDYEKVYKDGVYKQLTVDSNIFSFGRWNEGGKAITVINQSHDIQRGVEIEARQLSIKDNTILTDYLTGKTYKVKDGMVKIDVMPGGAVLVDGHSSSDYRAQLELKTIGNTDGLIIREGLSDFSVSGNGTFDQGLFGCVPGFNNASIQAKLGTMSDGKAALMMRDNALSGSAFYAAVFDENGNVTIQARANQDAAIETLTSFAIQEGQEIKIERHSHSEFKTYLFKDENWIEVEGSTQSIEMDYRNEMGIMPLEGNVTFEDLQINQTQSQLSSEFSDVYDSMLFYENTNASITNGQLNLQSDQQLGFAITQVPVGDFTLKTQLDYTVLDNEYAGLVARQDKTNYIIGGVMMIDGVRSVFLGEVVNGVMNVIDSKPYSESTVSLQIEKTGAYYQLLYSVDGDHWLSLSRKINANYSNVEAGLMVKGTSNVTADYLTFGNSQVDGVSLSNPEYIGELDYSYDLNQNATQTQSYQTQGGQWVYVVGGFRQTNSELSKSVLKFDNASFGDFKAEFSLNVHEMAENGYVAYRFGLDHQNVDIDQGYMLKLDNQGHVQLLENGTKIGEFDIQGFELNQEYRLIVDVQDSMIRIYMNERTIPVLSVIAQQDISGYMQITSSFSDYSIISPNVFHQSINWFIAQGSVTVNDSNVNLNPASANQPYHYSYLMNQGVTDVLFAANVKLEKMNIDRAHFGITIGSTVGKHPLYNGLYIGINDFGQIVIKENNEVLAYHQLEDINTQSFYLVVAVQNQEIKIYINDDTTPVLTYMDDQTRGGAIGFYTESAQVTLNYLDIIGLNNQENYELLDAFQQRTIDAPPIPNPSVSDQLVTEDIYLDLNDQATLGLLNRYNGTWEIVDGTLRVTSGQNNWNAGATIAAGKFKDFELSYSIKVEQGAWGGPIIRKNGFNDSHEASGLLMYQNVGDGSIVLYSTIESRPFSTILLDSEGFAHVIIKVVGNTVEISIGDGVSFETATYELTNAGRLIGEQGYISFNSGNATTIFKDISVRILDANGLYVNE
ncbi:MAG: hypothetical protein A2Y45_06285 [Tenericutes bacterium GWC2_34_14]|nr:MAG: hypothetical protein A2Y45_06285 [Tenericutes bacterium GWC2_34_14]OHE33529.1 MAG: hypothetical protein A2012_03525 [Tenericutes bacterium GWE2_34_108]OHE36814.1 MAG: hypothetical protein A2Y46_09325 [Tenericutes bacterium GWF1_35_14]OHE38106.1 MAG: hypothetical protein A2Y44_09340 [Tenericutes bacterium GWF2_35_184]OHE43377.1 MAG: hypothetical protein A2221_06395 [Tenericutes bacterium RIFOXYA2_FULL_36_32]OHE46705.1 MAG: hypothetical protein A2308_05980 [Tenericutes bacterium RIFOXYB2